MPRDNNQDTTHSANHSAPVASAKTPVAYSVPSIPSPSSAPTHYRTSRPVVGENNQVTTHLKSELVAKLDGGRFAEHVTRGIGFVYGGTTFTPVSLRSMPTSASVSVSASVSAPITASAPIASATNKAPASKPPLLDGPQGVALLVVLLVGSLSVLGSSLVHRATGSTGNSTTSASSTADCRSTACR